RAYITRDLLSPIDLRSFENGVKARYTIGKHMQPVISNPELSLVIPCYNEADAIENVVRDWCVSLDELVGEGNYEILIVNDGSTDGTGRILDRIRRERKCLRVIHQLNLGHDVAARRGYDLARGRFVAQIDGNGRFE